MIDSSPFALIKTFFKDSVAFLASVLVLVAGSYYLAAIYFSERVNLMASITYLISAISFSVLTIISLCYVGSDAYKLCRKLRSKGMRYFVIAIIILNSVGYIGTIFISAANVRQAAKIVSIPDELRKINAAPAIPKGVTWGQLAELYGDTLISLKQCNADKQEILKKIDKQ
ncbi:TPA: hypothetical protein NPO56_002978 [Klebsiella quasipneumoniae subsp. quasipneumoniae]|nr:hypothetical protein [Klebsiella quasipneumoniae subsp. quasipneumoniae]